jgi:hypothetical protein
MEELGKQLETLKKESIERELKEIELKAKTKIVIYIFI